MDIPLQAAGWLGLAILLGILEIATVGFFFIFFALGALVAAGASFYTDSILIQSLIFMGSSLLLILAARPVFKKWLHVGDRPQRASNVSALMGRDAVVLEPVDSLKGKVKVAHTGEVWSAYCPLQRAESISAGDLVCITHIDGAKLVVEPKDMSV